MNYEWMSWKDITDLAAANPWVVVGLAFGLVLGSSVLTATFSRRRRRKAEGTPTDQQTKPRYVENFLTLVAAGMATGVAAQGMWFFFQDVAGLHGFPLIASFAFVELAMVVSALRARRWLLDHNERGIDAAAAWGFACLSAFLAAWDANSPGLVFLRIAAPLAAAWLLERGLEGEHADKLKADAAKKAAENGDHVEVKKRRKLYWRVTPTRALAWAGLVQDSDEELSDLERTRKVKRMALISYYVHEGSKILRGWRSRRLVKATLSVDHGMFVDVVDRIGRAHHVQELTNPDTTAERLAQVRELMDMRRQALTDSFTEDRIRAAEREIEDRIETAEREARRRIFAAERDAEIAEARAAVAAVASPAAPERHTVPDDRHTAAALPVSAAHDRHTGPALPYPSAAADRHTAPALVHASAAPERHTDRHTQPVPVRVPDTGTDTAPVRPSPFVSAAPATATTYGERREPDPRPVADVPVRSVVLPQAALAPRQQEVPVTIRTRHTDAEQAEETPDTEPGRTYTERARIFWDAQVAKGIVPTGAQLSQASGAGDRLGRNLARKWREELGLDGEPVSAQPADSYTDAAMAR